MKRFALMVLTSLVLSLCAFATSSDTVEVNFARCDTDNYGMMPYFGNKISLATIGAFANETFGTIVNGGGSIGNCNPGFNQFGSGVVFEFVPPANYSVLTTFAGGDGFYPQTNVVQDSTGTIWGTLTRTGANGGEIFYLKYSSGVWNLTEPYNNVSGPPKGDIVLSSCGSDQCLTGTTDQGGANGNGEIWQYDITNPNFTDVYDLKAVSGGVYPDGNSILGGLALGSSGVFYGVASGGGAYGQGVIFSWSPTSGYTVLYNFCPAGGNCVDGAVPYGAPFIDSMGTLYGTTGGGGDSDSDGVIYQYVPGGFLTVLHTFGNSDGKQPVGELVSSGTKLWGTTTYGGAHSCGVVFSYSGTTYTDVYDFQGGTTDGCNTYAPITFDGGSMYTMTNRGGNNGGSMAPGCSRSGCGVLVKINP